MAADETQHVSLPLPITETNEAVSGEVSRLEGDKTLTALQKESEKTDFKSR